MKRAHPHPEALAEHHPDLAEENRRLRLKLREMAGYAEYNQEVMLRCQEQELALLGTEGLPDLLAHMSSELAGSFALDDVGLVLVDTSHQIRKLLAAFDGDGGLPPNVQIVERAETLSVCYHRLSLPWLGPWLYEEHHRLFRVSGLASVALVPMRRAGGLFGSINLGSKDRCRFTRYHSTDFLHRLGSVAAVCLENAINREYLRLTGLSDALTGLYNRRYLEQRLPAEVARAVRHGERLSCVFVDADHFKQINDTFGHETGDRVLAELARRIRSRLRASDLAIRYGGEEFLVILPETGADDACRLAERIRAHIADTRISLPSGEEIAVSASLGVKELARDPEQSVEQLSRSLIHDADDALYRAKSAGRNCVASSS